MSPRNRFLTVPVASLVVLAVDLLGVPRLQAQSPEPAPVPTPTNAANSATVAPNNLVIPAGFVSMQTRIFVPNQPPYDKINWAETAMGQIVAPLVAKFPELKWYWFSRYVQPVEGGEHDDTDLNKIPRNFFLEIQQPKVLAHRSLRLRFCLPAAKLADFEALGDKLIKAQGCAISDWRDWDLTYDNGSTRFIAENITPQRRAERADRIVQFYHATAALTLHCLVGPDESGYFRLEKNSNEWSEPGSIFEGPHHLFCNMTEVPLKVGQTRVRF